MFIFLFIFIVVVLGYGLYSRKSRETFVVLDEKPECLTLAIMRWLQYEMQCRGTYIQHAGNGQTYVIPGTDLAVHGFDSTNDTVYEFREQPNPEKDAAILQKRYKLVTCTPEQYAKIDWSRCKKPSVKASNASSMLACI